MAGVKRERSVTERSSKGGRQGKGAAPRPSTSPRAFPVLPSIRLRVPRGAPEGASHPPGTAAGVSPTDPRAMGPPGLDFNFPTTPAQWYDSAHPENGGPPSAGPSIPPPITSTNGGGADHGNGGFAYYPTGPGAAPPPHAQESFIRRDLGDGGVAPAMRGMPMWSGPAGTAPQQPQNYP
jgi:hypothetical protein